MTKSEFIDLSKQKYGDKFDYYRINLTRIAPESKIIITCRIHGDFITTARHHLDKACKHGGCKKCENTVSTRKARKRRTIRAGIMERDDYFACGGRENIPERDE